MHKNEYDSLRQKYPYTRFIGCHDVFSKDENNTWISKGKPSIYSLFGETQKNVPVLYPFQHMVENSFLFQFSVESL